MYQDEVFGAEKRTQVVFEVLLLPLATLCVAVTLPTALGSRVQLATALTARSATTTEANTVNDYDTLHRITAANYVTGSDEAFNYDVLGNRLAGITDRAGTTWNYANNLVNEYTSIDENGINPPAAATPVHDAAGNLTENAAGYAFDYDEENRVTRVYDDTNGNGVWDNTEPNHAEFRYDALGRRVEQTVDRNTGSEVVYRYYQELAAGAFGVDAETGGDRANVLVVYTFDDNNEYLARYFVNGPSYIDERVVMHEGAGTDPPDDRFYLYRDLWTVAAIARASGFLTEEYTYSVYGKPKLYQYTPGDRDLDGDVDDADAGTNDANFTACNTGAGVALGCGCAWADMDFDGDVDNTDKTAFDAVRQAGTATGPGPAEIDTSAENNPYFFTARRLDFLDTAAPTPLLVYDYRARTYDPVHGRFHQRDPSWYEDAYNLYQYVQSRPGRLTDPTGKFLLPGLTAGSALSAGITAYGFTTSITGAIEEFANGASFRNVMLDFAINAAVSYAGGKVAGKALDFLVDFAGPMMRQLGQRVGATFRRQGRMRHMQRVRRLGREGQAAAGLTPGAPKPRIESLTGTAKYRIPDELTDLWLKEVKNVSGRLRFTKQLDDFLRYSQANGLRFILVTRKGTVLAPRLANAVRKGLIEHQPILP